MAAPSGAAADQAFVAVWTRVWCLHQLAPFANVLLGITGGAIDNWPLQGSLNWWHWHVRFPIVLLACAWPTPHVAVCAHLCNLTFFCMAMPFVWDHMVWASLTEVSFVVAVVASGFQAFQVSFTAMARTHTIISYFCAGFWKLTTSFLDPKYSCGTLLSAELLSILPGQFFEPGGGAAETMLRCSGWLTVAGEFAISFSLACLPRFGVMLGLSFHLVILLLPVNAAGGFSLSCAAVLVSFVPRGAALAVPLLTRSVAGAGAAAAAVAVAFSALGGTADAHFGGFLALAVLLVCAAALERRSPEKPEPTPSATWVGRLLAASLALCHGIVGPVLGVQQMASLTMYGNVQHWGRSNHLLVPTALLQDLFWDAPPDAPLRGAFAGGAVRVDSCDLPPELLRTPADAAGLVPPRVRRLLASVGNPGRFYVPYYARMAGSDFFGDAVSGNGSAADGFVSWQLQPFAVPALEIRRLLALARARGAPFELRYTPLPREARTPGQWARHAGPQVLVRERPEEGQALCEVLGPAELARPCGPDELAALLPPPSWIARVLLQYPVPLAEDSDVELPCIS